jgi:hypothetical protein
MPILDTALVVTGILANPRNLITVAYGSILAGGRLVARISWAERLGLGSVEDHSPIGERDFASRWSRLLSP